MKKIVFLTALLAFSFTALAFEDETGETQYFIKLNVIGEKPGSDDTTAAARIEIQLINSDNVPLAGVPISLDANCGKFGCDPPGENSIPDSLVQRICFTTDNKGVARVYLVEIPFNVQVKITASADYEGVVVSGTGNVSFSKKSVKK